MDLELLRKCLECGDPMTERMQNRIPGVRRFQARGMCTLCYQIALRAGEIEARARVEYTDTDIKCMKCQEWKPKSAFKRHKNTVLGYEHTCRMCGKLGERYGLTSEQYVKLFEEQDYKCVICSDEVLPFGRRSHVDHDHACCLGKDKTCGNCVRGILCGHCNTGLGMFRDNPDTLAKAINYLKNNESRK